MSAFSDYYENMIINHMFRNQAFTVPTTVYVALFLTGSTGLESDSPTNEVNATGYIRKAITFSEPVGGVSSNSSDIIWEEAEASWGEVSYAAVVDHETNTNWGTDVHVLVHGSLVSPKTVGVGDIFKILAGNFNITVL